MPTRQVSAKILGIVAAASLTAAGCSSVGSVVEEAETDPVGAESEAPADLALTAEVEEEAGPAELDLADFTLGMVRPATWAPTDLSNVDQSAVIIADLLYDGLTEVDGVSGTLEPGLATSWSANENFTEWTFQLDTSRVDAGIVVASFDALLASQGLSREVLVGDVVAVTEVDPSTVVIATSKPAAGLPWRLSGVGASVVGPEGATTGHYRLDSDALDETQLLANDGAVTIRWASSADEAYGWLNDGSVDAAVVGEGNLEAAIDTYGADLPPRNVTQLLVLNARSSSLASEPQRQAIMAALDRDSLAAVIGERSYPADGVASPSIAGFTAATCGTACGGDPGSFSAVLVGESLSNLRLGFTSLHQQPLADEIVAQLANVGVTVEATQLGSDELARQLISGEIDLAISGWVLPASSLDAAVPALFGPTSATNSSGGASLSVEALLDEAALTGDDQARWDLLNQAQTDAIQLGLAAPLGYGKSRLVTASDDTGLVQRADGSLDLSER